LQNDGVMRDNASSHACRLRATGHCGGRLLWRSHEDRLGPHLRQILLAQRWRTAPGAPRQRGPDRRGGHGRHEDWLPYPEVPGSTSGSGARGATARAQPVAGLTCWPTCPRAVATQSTHPAIRTGGGRSRLETACLPRDQTAADRITRQHEQEPGGKTDRALSCGGVPRPPQRRPRPQ
jgi:hypothetical protein